MQDNVLCIQVKVLLPALRISETLKSTFHNASVRHDADYTAKLLGKELIRGKLVVLARFLASSGSFSLYIPWRGTERPKAILLSYSAHRAGRLKPIPLRNS